MIEKPVSRRTVLTASLTAVVGAGLAACGSRPSEQAATKTDKPLVIGVSLPLTGDFSQPGSEAKRGYQVWADQINKAGGLLGRPVRLTIVDDASSQDTVVSDYTKLITQDKVDLVLGTFSSLLNYAASAVAEKNNMVFVEPAGGAPKMFTRGFKNLFFAQPATAPHQADVFVDWIKSLPAGQRPATAAYPSQDDPFAKPVIDSMREQLEALGVRTVYTSTYPADTTNFQSIASQMAGKKPDLIAQGAVFEDGVGLVRSLKQLRYSPKIMFQTSAPSNAGQYSSGVGEGSTEGVFYTVSWHQDAHTPHNAEFVADYQAAYQNADPAEDAADAYAAAQVLQAAVTAVGAVDQTKIRDWLHANTVQTILGPLSWADNGEPQGKFLLAQWQSGTAQVVAPPDAATSQTIVNPKPDWK
ncbi:amino acid ABC transporter substrate-binding protein [Mangrovihabitans endophyticus]|uniref:Branched-chain amino acid ABC transporter substrate-binding protein n=1 Tax=Mangrovihabitans endophyticus TaxID=1751298 RepID=A0A8J3C081_9ACTN|nr:amino acid ABC transporter substrate-binding protein [Mangrovihabitans endophyticus]GGL00095.1 branched-chain amino acid ABC transporter substrate-binding protein [Mangrovihabitans endophyticus]